MKPILALIDFSDTTPGLLETAAELATGLGRDMVVLHVADPASADEPGDDSAIADEEPGVAEGRELRVGRRKLRIIELELKRRGLRATTLLVPPAGTRQSPAGLIVEQIGRLTPGFVVVGSHEHGRLYQMLVGGVAQEVLRGSRCPVVIVPAVMSNTGTGTVS